jgi:hypothetical protein
MAILDKTEPQDRSTTTSDRRQLIEYLRYVVEEVAAVNLTSAALLGEAIAHLEDDEDNPKCGLRERSSSLS